MAADALGSAFSMETLQKRAMKLHAQAMKRWRETCRELRQQDAKAWETMKARSAIAPLNRRRRNSANSLTGLAEPQYEAVTSPTVSKSGLLQNPR